MMIAQMVASVHGGKINRAAWDDYDLWRLSNETAGLSDIEKADRYARDLDWHEARKERARPTPETS